MNKAEFISAVADRANITKKESEEVINAVLDTIADALAEGEKVVLSGFGTFEVRERSERVGRNPQTGEEIKIAGSKVPALKVGKLLKDSINRA